MAKEKEKKTRKAAKKAEGGRPKNAEPAPPRPDSDAGEASDEAAEPEVSEREALAVRAGEGASLDAPSDGDGEQSTLARERDDVEDGDGDEAATTLGTERYVLAGFFGAAILSAYIVGRLIHGVWATLSNKDWFSHSLPQLAAVPDDSKTTYGTIIGATIAIIAAIRVYRKPEVRTWSDEVATELTKVKWPTKKEVTNSTVIVIAASAVATVYLMLLDRLWGFITNLVYGSGS